MPITSHILNQDRGCRSTLGQGSESSANPVITPCARGQPRLRYRAPVVPPPPLLPARDPDNSRLRSSPYWNPWGRRRGRSPAAGGSCPPRSGYRPPRSPAGSGGGRGTRRGWPSSGDSAPGIGHREWAGEVGRPWWFRRWAPLTSRLPRELRHRK